MNDWKMVPAGDLQQSEASRCWSVRRECGLISTAMHSFTWDMVKAYLATWHRLRIEGAEHLPAEPPFVMVSNHGSHLDALVLGAAFPVRARDTVFPLAAGDVFFSSSIRAICAAKMLNALPMWRKRCGAHALADLRHRLLEEPCSFILFPEGGRSRDGQLMTFKSGIGMLVAETNVPVIPCYIDGAFQALRPGSFVPARIPIHLQIGSPMRFFEVPNEREGWSAIAHCVREAVQHLREDRPTNPAARTEISRPAT
jgi:1-acyl-sn-glycerol-3-phosphate acyltransferase